MKRTKRTLLAAGTMLFAAATLAACGGGSGSQSTSPDEATSGAADSGQTYNITITQIVTHASLDESIAGFKAALADAGLKVNYDEQNANNDQTVVASISGSVASSNADLVLGVGTPMAQGLAQSVTKIPVLFTAVTDPEGAGLVDTLESPGANVTGTSDANPVEEQISLIKEIVPDAKKIGVISNPGEANSQVQVEWVKEAAKELDLEVVEAGAVTTAEVQQAANSLNVDAIYVPTDNTIVSALDSVIQIGEQKGIPVFAAEGDSVKNGALATYGISYYQLGYQTGQMAVQILTEGADPATMPVETQKDLLLYLNTSAAERMKITIPDSVLERAEPENVFTK